LSGAKLFDFIGDRINDIEYDMLENFLRGLPRSAQEAFLYE